MRKLLALIAILALPNSWADQTDSMDSKPAYDYLWLLNEDEAHLGAGLDNLLRLLKSSQVPDAEKARTVAIKEKMRVSGGWMATESARVTGLIKIGRNVAGFANQGDLVWIVQISDLRCLGCTTQELWISSSTGYVKSIVPF